MSLKSMAAGLAGELKATSEYAELKAAKSAINRDRSLKSKFEDLRRKQSGLYSGRLSAREAESRMTEINEDLKKLSNVPEFGRYMNASAKFSEILNDVFKQINESIEAGLG